MKTSLSQSTEPTELSDDANLFLGFAVFFYTLVLTLSYLAQPFLVSLLDQQTLYDQKTAGAIQDAASVFTGLSAYFWLPRYSWKVLAMVAVSVFAATQVLTILNLGGSTLVSASYILGQFAKSALAVICFVSVGMSPQRERLFACIALGSLLAATLFPMSMYWLGGMTGSTDESSAYTSYHWALTALTLCTLPLAFAFTKPQQFSLSLVKENLGTALPLPKLLFACLALLLFSIAASLSYGPSSLILFNYKEGQVGNIAMLYTEIAKVVLVVCVIIFGSFLRSVWLLAGLYSLALVGLLGLSAFNTLNSLPSSFFIIAAALTQIAFLALRPLFLAKASTYLISYNYLISLYLMTVLGVILSIYLYDLVGIASNLGLLLSTLILLIISLGFYLLSNRMGERYEYSGTQ
jgi:hypothetical protein